MSARAIYPDGTALRMLADEGVVHAGDSALARAADRLLAGAASRDLAPETVFVCCELVRDLAEVSDEQRESLLLLLVALLACADDGSTRVSLGDEIDADLGPLMTSLTGGRLDRAALERHLANLSDLAGSDRARPLLGDPESHSPIVIDGDFAYQRRFFACEVRIASNVASRLAGAKREVSEIETALADVMARPAVRAGSPIELSTEQQTAVMNGLRGSFAVITGGPGTGKTAIVSAILRTACRLGISPEQIALAAPTGKAAQRLADSLTSDRATIADPAEADRRLIDSAPRAHTLHRLLGYSPRHGQFLHHRNHPIPARLIIVDEASMVGLSLLDRLLQATSPETSVLLLGDAGQLPSVEAGAAFRDLVEFGERCAEHNAVARLSRSYRMNPADPAGRQVLTAANLVASGQADQLLDANKDFLRRVERAADVTFSGVELVDTDRDPRVLSELLDRWFATFGAGERERSQLAKTDYRLIDGALVPESASDIARLLELGAQARILTVTRSHALGADAVNRWMHSRAHGQFGGRAELYPGELVLVERNDYRRGLFNGDQGVVVRTEDEAGSRHLRVIFPTGEELASYHADSLRAHTVHAAATTVHKSQGSEFDHVLLVLPGLDLPLATRELIYTGMTRARRSVTIVGREEILRRATRRQITRQTGLGERLMRLAKPSAGDPSD